MDLVIFWLVAPVAVGAAALMLLQPNAVRAALLLVVTQFAIAVMFVLLGAHFLAAVQVIVYAGAIMVLFLFVLMFLGVDRRESLRETIRGQRLLAVGLGVLLVGAVVTSVRLGVGLTAAPPPEAGARVGGNVQAVSEALFTKYVFPFEVTSILLIVAAIAAMVLAGKGKRPRRKHEESDVPDDELLGPGEAGSHELPTETRAEEPVS